MKYLIATIETQGQRDNDFCFVPEGEMVYPGSTCDNGSIDDECGCLRSWAGYDATTGTTTMRVSEGKIEDVMTTLRFGLERAGYYKPGKATGQGRSDTDPLDDETVEGVMVKLTREISEACVEFNVDDVVELREHGFRLRPVKSRGRRMNLEVVK